MDSDNTMMAFPPEVRLELTGWTFRWYSLEPTGQGIAELGELKQEICGAVRIKYAGIQLSDSSDIQAVRRLFREAGCDPTRYRPSSEALLRRVLKGEDLPSIHPLVDLNNLLSIELAAPCCVVDSAKLEPPFVFRAGKPGEVFQSLRGPFPLEGKPLLEDAKGPFGTPITDSERVKVTASTTKIWMVVYLPRAELAEKSDEVLRSLLAGAPVARVQ